MACVSTVYVRKSGLHVPCGKCGNCLKRAISDWAIRLQVEWRNSMSCYWVTLTYEKDPLQLYKSDLQRFFKRLRKVGFKFSYFALGDYGDTFGRPHYHVIFFSKGYFQHEYLHSLWISGDQTRCRGFVSVAPLTVGRIYYCVRYGLLAKLDWPSDDHRAKPFFLMSKRPALGSSYLTRAMKSWHRRADTWFFPDKGYKKPLPRYLRDKIFPVPLRRAENLARFQLIADERRFREFEDFRSQGLNPYLAWEERHHKAADSFLEQLRFQKLSKNKNL